MTRNTKAKPPSEEQQHVSLLRTKLHRPPVTEKLVCRKRLHVALDLGLRQIQHYLLEEVLARLPAAVQDWLMKTSILDRFCAPLCEAICTSDHEAAGTCLVNMNGWMEVRNAGGFETQWLDRAVMCDAGWAGPDRNVSNR